MDSQNVIMILIVVALLFFVATTAVTISSVYTKMVPKVQINEAQIVSSFDKGQVSISVTKP